jgi:uncharacterized protein (DUF4415 family)
MNDYTPASSFKNAAEPKEKLEIDHAILAWFKERGASWQQEIEGVLDFYIHTVEQPASVPDHEPPGPEPGPV